jgi:hypothetical protein
LPVTLGRLSCSTFYPRLPSFAVLTAHRALFARAGLFEVDLDTGVVVKSDTSHAPCQISADADTIAVGDVASSGEIGLSLNAGKSFDWTHVGNLVRCQDSGIVASGGAMLISCISGVQRWTGGSDTPTPISATGAKLFRSGSRVVIGTAEGLRLSDDSGAHFSDRPASGIYSGATVVSVVGDSIYAVGRSASSEPTLYAAYWTEPFQPIVDKAPLSHSSTFDSWHGVLTLSDETRILIRKDRNSGFREIELFLQPGGGSVGALGEIHYAFGNLYVLAEQPSPDPDKPPEVTLYIAKLPELKP